MHSFKKGNKLTKKGKKKKRDDVAQLECSNNKCYTSAFSNNIDIDIN